MNFSPEEIVEVAKALSSTLLPWKGKQDRGCHYYFRARVCSLFCKEEPPVRLTKYSNNGWTLVCGNNIYEETNINFSPEEAQGWADNFIEMNWDLT